MGHGIKHSRSQGLIDFAYRFAKNAHGDQKRKYTGEPYITHPVAVARMVASITDDCQAICAALLHDVIEDCGVTYEDLLKDGFSWPIVNIVRELTDVDKSFGNRIQRKAADRERLRHASDKAKTVKLADLIHNTGSIVEHDPGFSKLYIQEKALLLPCLVGGDETLWNQAKGIVDEIQGLHHREAVQHLCRLDVGQARPSGISPPETRGY